MRNSIFTCCRRGPLSCCLDHLWPLSNMTGKDFLLHGVIFRAGCCFFCIFGFGRVPKESFPGLWALLPCIGTALCIYGGTSAKETWAGRILSGRVMAGIGLISYSLYLYHWPFLVFFRQTSLEPVSDTWELLPVFGAVFALSCLSYFFVEQPIRKKRVLRTRRVLFTAAFAAYSPFFCLDILEENTSHLMCLTGRKHICLKKGNGIL